MPTILSAPEIAIGAEAAIVAVSTFTSVLSAVRPTRVAASAEAMPIESASSDAPPRHANLLVKAIFASPVPRFVPDRTILKRSERSLRMRSLTDS